MRSISRPAGRAASAPAASTIAGPRPSSPSTWTTCTSVSDATAAASCSVAEFIASELDSSAVLRPIGRVGAGADTAGERTRRRGCGECVSPCVHDSPHQRPSRPLRLRRAHACRLARDRCRARDRRGPGRRRHAGEDDHLLRDDRRRPRRAVLAATARPRLEARGARRPRCRAAQGPPRPPPLAAVLRPAVGLPARRRGVDRARGDPRHPRLDLHVGVAPAGGARAVHRRRGRPAGQPLRPEPDPQPQAPPRAAGADDHHRRLGRQPADQRDAVGRRAARGRAGRSQLGRRGRRLRHARRPARRGRPLHRRAGRQRRARVRPLLRPQPAVGDVRRLAALPRPHGPRPAPVRGRRPEAAELRRLRQPRRHGPGQPARARAARRARQGLRQAALAVRPVRPRRAPHRPRPLDHRAARPAARLRRPADVQGAARHRPPARRARLRLRRRRRARGVQGAGGLLRLHAEAGPADDRAQHGRRGRRHQLQRQPRQPAVSLAATRDRGRRAPRRADRRLRPPPVRQPRRTRRPTRTPATARCAR